MPQPAIRSAGTRYFASRPFTMTAAWSSAARAAARRASRGPRTLDLTSREFDLFELFVRHRGEVLSKTRILEALWGYAYDPNLVEVYIGYLRRKLGEPPLLETVRGSGYRLAPDDLASGDHAAEIGS